MYARLGERAELDEAEALGPLLYEGPDDHGAAAVGVEEVGRGHRLREEGEHVLGRHLRRISRDIADEDLAGQRWGVRSEEGASVSRRCGAVRVCVWPRRTSGARGASSPT
eukprot:scaffold10351_cov62-Phaeocystis_antarctica.AAC.18